MLDLLVVLAENKWLIVGLPLLTGALAFGASFLITPTYTSMAKIMPPQQQQSSGVSAMLGQLGGLAGAAGGIAGLKNPSDLYVGVLESRTIADKLVSRFKLQERYDTKTFGEARKELLANTVISSGKKDGFISVVVDDHEPQAAADIANAYMEELATLTSTLALSEASKRRMFFEAQLKDAKDQLASAELVLRSTQEKTGMIQPGPQVAAILTNAAQLKGTIAAKEVQIKAMRTFAAGQNPELMRAMEELRGLQMQLAKLESNRGTGAGDFMVPTGKIPEVGVEYVRNMRNIKYYETIFELLARQYELAKIDEAKESSLIQVLDKAIPAERKSKPSRALFLLGGMAAGLVLGMLIAFIRDGYRRSRANPDSAHRWAQLAGAWRRPAHAAHSKL